MRTRVVVLFWMQSIFRTGGPFFLATARAFTTSSTPFRLFSYKRVIDSSQKHLSSSDSNNINGEKQEREGKTGWQHNLPSDQSSFWESGPEQKPTTRDPFSSSEPRTGWLHNTEPPDNKKEEEEEEKTGKVSEARRRLELAMKQQERNHRIISPPAFHACGEGRAMVVTEHMISLPVFRPNKTPRINIYFSIVEKIDSDETRKFFEELSLVVAPQKRAEAYVERAALKSAEDLVLYLQGGPGFGAPTPIFSLGASKGSSWAAKALDTYSRVVLLDQRGTGRSTPVTKQVLEKKFPDLFLFDKNHAGSGRSIEELESSHPDEVARVKKAVTEVTDFLAQFRADSIVKDAEEIRDALLLPQLEEEEETPRPWGCALGQSFGGFCLMTYLSFVEHPPRICLFTGGIAPMLTPAYDAYDALWDRVKERSLRYYDMYPGDIAVVNKIVQKLMAEPAVLPSGGKLTARRFLNLGLSLGGSPSTFASLHALFASAFVDTGDDDSELEFSRAFLKRVESEQSFDDHPFYYWLHESIYADGPENSPTNWAAHRAYENKIKIPTEFDYKLTSSINSDERPTLFFGEMVFPWMAEDFAELGGIGLTAVANTLASKTDWGPLYNGDNMRKALEEGSSHAAAAVYHDDMYVDFDASLKVTARGAPMEKCKVWVTNEYQHSGLRDDGAKIFAKLHGMATGSIRTPS